MASVDPGEVFIDDIVAGRIKIDQNTENHNVSDNEDFGDDASCFTTGTVDSVNATDIYGNNGTGPGNEGDDNNTNQHSEIAKIRKICVLPPLRSQCPEI